MESSKVLKDLYHDETTYIWLGDGVLVVGNHIRSRNCYDVHIQVIPRKEEGLETAKGHQAAGLPWTADLDAEQLATLVNKVAGFDPAIEEMVGKSDRAWLWRMTQVPELPSWSSEDGRVVLIGDAAHGLLPYIGVGMSMNLESVGVMVELLARHDGSLADLGSRIKLYESIRKSRTTKMAEAASFWGQMQTMAPGPEQESRDKMIGLGISSNKEIISDGNAPVYSPQFLKWITDYDAIAEVSFENTR